MDFDNLTPRAKVVQPIRKDTRIVIHFNQVMAERCASDAPYRYIFEAVRSVLGEVELLELSHDIGQGSIVTGFRWLWIIPLKLSIAFYSAGVSTVIDADNRPGRGWFHRAREKKAMQLVERLTRADFEGAALESAASVHAETVRPPMHSV